MVFGIDAPWGTGKSSFINFCCEYWKNNKDLKPIVLRFEPLRYKESEDLVDKLVSTLIDAIQKEAFLPSINSLFSKYLRQVKGKREVSFLGLNFEFESSSGSVEETLKSLEVHLSELNRKIIIVVDDLDRLSWAEVKNILFAIKRSFMLPNVSYVLCYDTENLTSLKNESFDDAEKVKEFLEKFVNVEIGLFLDSKILAEFVSSDINSAINKNLQLDPHLLDQIKLALDALVKIYGSNDYVFYQDFLGDIRKIKRLINTMMLFEIQKTDFSNSDFNKHDLIHLLLVYINYPNIFRKIYNSETDGKNGFFSLVRDFIGSSMELGNSSKYIDYIKELNSNQQFLLNKIFNHEILISSLKYDQQEVDQQLDMYSRACFNDSTRANRNLERYLNLIVKLAKQDKLESYQFYVSRKNELLSGKKIDELFQSNDFSFAKGDFSRDQLWSVLANSANEMNPKIGSDIVIYLMDNLPDYSFIDREKVGARSRQNLVYSLLKFLDVAAWGANLTGRRNNNEKNISEIAEWVFGEGGHASTGVLSTLSKPERGPLGLFDLLLFRLYCSADRGSSLFNLQRAISLHGNPKAPTSGITTEIAKEGMREISQTVFQIFLKQYIEPKKNIFEAIDNLSLDNFAGKTAGFVLTQIKIGEVSQGQIDELIAAEKSKLKSFIIYQLGNSMISSGVGCGCYDEAGNFDNNGIAAKINEYLFDLCFNPEINQENYERFLDYLLLNFADKIWEDDGNRYVANLSEFTKVLDKEQLKKYWLQNRETILGLNFELKEKRVLTGNYYASYNEDLKDVYRVLDELISDEII
ncbi:MAG: P-loop ATPase [Methylophilaceae bacterium]|nr:P-loop ATPase [Methylophilaceae bacterium]